jgi:hypothetical protein
VKVIENFQNLKAIESKKISTKLSESEKFLKPKPKSNRPKSENFQGNLKVRENYLEVF